MWFLLFVAAAHLLRRACLSSDRNSAQEIRQQRAALPRFFDRRPMAAAVKHHGLGAADPVGELMRDAGRPDRILVAGDDQGWAVDEPVIGALSVCQRLAGAGKSFRILAHMAL